ncbi:MULTISPECIES: Dps family protein [Brevibacillus]|jgi:starvation-inducible DNA-binding protein|uniref:DNA protection during starvation protein n=1 Tax=Brevibacillus borstelensis AK1 TaxID=1300222 RepID=M8DIN3_9BACL|nr:DNA starvation/stationary phase protection protein [Brevibacillus borstelensis]EMT53292.1 DNA protection during starvation protein [Brevibacillus borstelensis AK1]MBE5394824.1 DNA starvation/stationary phase protection protein [Brevibacillus borstelensis]MCC0566096.1 DNA starvation/stationary phase protection protein [Brevibacillus borstelensis]MCM3473488.1 DNA starvation/stationary phase protection protein [Brevibacillus borstelensis]MCM3560810.1 DNA starvation/stationary phase protection 
MENLYSVLNKQVANWTILRMKLQNYHWNVKGPAFFTLHDKFEELYNEASEHIDTLAERILARNGKPVATLGECIRDASIEEASDRETAEEMVQTLIEDFTTVIDELKDGIKKVEELGDEGTADMLLSIQTSLEKHVWMLKAFQG